MPQPIGGRGSYFGTIKIWIFDPVYINCSLQPLEIGFHAQYDLRIFDAVT